MNGASRRTPLVLVSRTDRNDDYVTSLEKAGAEPLLVGATGDVTPHTWLRIRGVLLTGGPDVDPSLYGATPHPAVERAEPGRDALELELVARAVERGLPVLGICRGAQVMNVAFGGTLVQDIPDCLPLTLDHQVTTPAWAIAHSVSLDATSQVARALVGGVEAATVTVPVNSRHHQAVGHLAPGLSVAGTAPDGVIECIERPDSRFCVGVQWHPENFWRGGEFDGLFRAFVDASR